MLAVASSAFQAVNGQVQAAVARQLKAGDAQVRLAAGQLPTVTFSVTNKRSVLGLPRHPGLDRYRERRP